MDNSGITELVRKEGGCGEIGTGQNGEESVCIQEINHAGPHGWEKIIDFCYACGISSNEAYLTEFHVIVAQQEEGHSDVRRYFCEFHAPDISYAFRQLGFTVHAHGGICELEADCPGEDNPDDCPTPEPQYGD